MQENYNQPKQNIANRRPNRFNFNPSQSENQRSHGNTSRRLSNRCKLGAEAIAQAISEKYEGRLVYQPRAKRGSRWLLDGKPLHPLTLRALLVSELESLSDRISKALVGETEWFLKIKLGVR